MSVITLITVAALNCHLFIDYESKLSSDVKNNTNCALTANPKGVMIAKITATHDGRN